MIITNDKLNDKFNGIINKYLLSGYKILVDINHDFTSHHDLKFVLIKPEDNAFIEIYLLSKYDRNKYRNMYSIQVVKTIVKGANGLKKYIRVLPYKNDENLIESYSTIESYDLYSIGFDYNSNSRIFTDSLEEFEDILNTRKQRSNVKYSGSSNEATVKIKVSVENLSPKLIDHLMERANKLPGFKRANATCIKNFYSYRVHEYGNPANSYKRYIHVEFNNGKKTHTFVLQ